MNGRREDGSYDILWLTPQGTEMTVEDWNFPDGRFVSYMLAPLLPEQPPVYVVLNAAATSIDVTLPAEPPARRWVLHLDTATMTDGQVLSPGARFSAAARSVLLFAAEL